MKILFVSGTFDTEGGRASSVTTKLVNALQDTSKDLQITAINGGKVSALPEILELTKRYDVVFWWANVSNDEEKVRDVKKVNSHCILITSKVNTGNKYTYQEIVNRALGAKANLCLIFKKDSIPFEMELIDPLGNSWYKGTDIDSLAKILMNRIPYLMSITRKKTVMMPPDTPVEVPEQSEFFELIKGYADTFHSLICPAEGVERFLGNSSFRCTKGGFPSFRTKDYIYVSKRNVDKRFIDRTAFVPVKLDEATGDTLCYSDCKPSVDTPIQLALYKALPKINYMIHSHTYIEGAPFTMKMVPCGGYEEVQEVLNIIRTDFAENEPTNDDWTEDCTFYAINLVNHGSLILSNDIENLKNVKYIAREMPEQGKN